MLNTMGGWSKLTRTVAPAVTAVSLSEAKAHLRVEHTTDDAYITTLIAVAEAMIDGPSGIGVAMTTQTWTITFDGFLPMPLYLPLWPVQSVSSITYVDSDGDTQTLNSALYQFAKGNPAVIDRALGAALPAVRRQLNAATVTFVAGFGATASSVPADLRHALLLMIGHLYHRRETTNDKQVYETPLGYTALTERFRVGRFG